MSDWHTNEYGTISTSEMEDNALIIHNVLSAQGWSDNAISAILGNMEIESGINPARWENDDVGNTSGGFGLVQWTPATKLFDWVDEYFYEGYLPNTSYDSGYNQLERILYELRNGIQYAPTAAYKESFREWSVSDKNPGYLAAAFMLNYERPLDQKWGAQIKRAKNARKWHIFITGTDPGGWIPPAMLITCKKSVDNGRGIV